MLSPIHTYSCLVQNVDLEKCFHFHEGLRLLELLCYSACVDFHCLQ